jgi:hypothetical protein
MTIAKRLLDVFEGSDAGYLVTVVGDKGKKGKTEADYRTRHGQVTEALIQDHLDGKKGVGIVPIKKDVCKFGVIDIDDYGLDHAILQKNIQRLKMPLVHCRSKSGGAHLYLFFNDWESCAVVRDLLEELRAALGYSGSGDLFPAQDSVNQEENQIGNGINIPYFNAELPTRYAYGPNMDALEVEEFLDSAEKSRVSLASFQELDFAGEKQLFSDGPICLQLIAAEGSITESRNICMFNIGVYCLMKWPDDWEHHMEEYNRTLCDPPLPASEIVALQSSLKKKSGYFYQCTVCPLKDFCNKAKCKMQKFGIGSGGEDYATISGITIMLSEPRLYFMSVDGKNLTLKTEDLQNPHLWQKACMEQLDIMPPKPKNADWQQLINSMLSTATKQEVSKELTWSGKFENLLRQYCTSYVRAVAPEEVLLGKPWTDNGKTMFKIDALEKYLRNNDFTRYDTGQIQDRIQKLNGESKCQGHLNYHKEDGKRSNTRVWWVPEFGDDEVKIDIKEDKYDIPF